MKSARWIKCASRAWAFAMLAGSALSASPAAAQSAVWMPMPPGAVEAKPLGISNLGSTGQDGVMIAYRAIKEQGVQRYSAAGLWSEGQHYEAPQPQNQNGDYLDVEMHQYRPLASAGDPIKGINIGLVKKPQTVGLVWDTRQGPPGTLNELAQMGAISEARSASLDGSVIVGTRFSDDSGNHAAARAIRYQDGVAQEFTMPPMYVGSEGRGVSGDGSVAVGVAYRGQRDVNDGRGVIWGPGNLAVVLENTSPDMLSSEFKGVSDDGQAAYATISTTRSNAKGGMYRIATGELTLLDGGDINGDGVIDMLDDHDSFINAVSADGSVVGGSLRLMGGEERAALWVRDSEGSYGIIDITSLVWGAAAVTAVSPDGSMMAGSGMDPQGQASVWYSWTSVPAPGTLALAAAGLVCAARRRR